MLPVAVIEPSLAKLPPRTLPVVNIPLAPAVIDPVVIKLPPLTLPVAVINPPVAMLPPVTLPVAVIRPPVLMLPAATLANTVVLPLMYAVPVTPNVVLGAVLAMPTLPVCSTVTLAAKLPGVPVKICTLLLPPVSTNVARIDADTPAAVTSLVNHSTAPNIVPAVPVVSVSWNLIVGWPRLASRRIVILPVVSTLPNVTLAATTPVTVKFPIMALPEILELPLTLNPDGVNTATFETPPTVMLALPLAAGISILVVPLNNLSPEMLPVNVALPVTVKFPSTTTVTALATLPAKVMVFAPRVCIV